MALRVWLPLTGTLDNQGVSNVSFTNNGATVNNSGKIGSCYSFNGSSTSLRSTTSLFTNDTQEFSYTCWFKPASTTIGCLFSCRTSTGKTGIAIFVNSSGTIFFDAGGARRSFSYALAANTWYHLAFTYKAGDKKVIYINGIQVDSISSTGSMTTVSTNMFIGASQNKDTAVSGNYLNGLLNDVRIYDHCLSASEVHEISQGLVLHYKLDASSGSFANPNLLTGNINETNVWTADGVTLTKDDNALKIVDNNSSNRRIYKGVSNVWTTSGDIFTVSFDARAATNGQIIRLSRSVADYAPNITLTTTWQHYSAQITNTTSVTGGTLSIQSATSSGTFWIKNIKLEKGTIETRFLFHGETASQIQDSSGYGHNGTINGTLTLSNDTPRYSACTVFNGTDARIKVPNLTPDAITVSFWMKRNANTGTRQFLYTAWSGVTCELTTNGTTTFAVNKSSYPTISGSTITTSSGWIHYCGTFDTTNGLRLYENGILKSSNTSNLNAISWNISTNYIGYYNTYYNGLISDFRIYATALSADDIKQLYQVGAKVDNLGGLHTFEAVENIPNIIFKIDSARGAKIFQNGLGSYTQANCQVTLTNNGYRIYRPPNLTTSANGNTMWGGLKLVNQTSDTVSAYTTPRDNCWNLQKNHTYLCAFHAKGQSSNGTSFSWTNNMGWGGGGVSPSPTIIVNDGIPDNFQGEKDCIFIFTIGDTLSKTCTTAYSSYVAGTTYLSYRHLTFGWGYTSTGALGTDIYITNLRLYDITNFIGKIKKTGQANFSDFVENNSIARILKNSEFLTNNLIER